MPKIAGPIPRNVKGCESAVVRDLDKYPATPESIDGSVEILILDNPFADSLILRNEAEGDVVAIAIADFGSVKRLVAICECDCIQYEIPGCVECQDEASPYVACEIEPIKAAEIIAATPALQDNHEPFISSDQSIEIADQFCGQILFAGSKS